MHQQTQHKHLQKIRNQIQRIHQEVFQGICPSPKKLSLAWYRN